MCLIKIDLLTRKKCSLHQIKSIIPLEIGCFFSLVFDGLAVGPITGKENSWWIYDFRNLLMTFSEMNRCDTIPNESI